MSFKLIIEFSGLCMHVLDRKSTPAMLHVLLLTPGAEKGADPAAGYAQSHASHVEPHYARLFYDSAYDNPDSKELTGKFNCISLDDKVLDLTGIHGLLGSPPAELPNVSEVTGCPADPEVLTTDVARKAAARVVLGAGTATPLRAEGPWKLDPKAPVGFKIAHTVAWTLDVAGDGLVWRLGEWHGLGGHPLAPIHPVDGQITLKLKNVMRDDLSPDDLPPDTAQPSGNFLMDHFTPYYGVLVKGPANGPVPQWAGPAGTGGPIGGDYRCGGAQAFT